MTAAASAPPRPALQRDPGAFLLRAGPFTARVRTRIPALRDEIASLYAGFPLDGRSDFVDFHVSVDQSRGPRRWYRPKVWFSADGLAPFKPLPLNQATPMFEWGLNWCISSHANHFLIVHAAAIEKDGCAVIMPGTPGSGKSTLTAGLVNRGWRLLSDELTLISFTDGRITGLARPISLKNQSIAVMRKYVPDAIFSREAADTAKGTVALMRAPDESIARVAEPARPAWIIFPKFAAGRPASLEPRSKAVTLIQIARNSFNYSIHGARGFTVFADIVDACGCYTFTYGNLDDAVEVFASLKPRA